jgi:pimeloyl-ACP methyl ester carboxylesterase
VAFVFLPGTQCSGRITIEPYLRALREFGPVAAMDYARYNFSYEPIREAVFAEIRRLKLPVVFIGQSLGAAVEAQLLADYPADLPRVVGIWTDSGVLTGRYVKWPVPPWIIRHIPRGPLLNLLGRVVEPPTVWFKQRKLATHGPDEQLYWRAFRYLTSFPLSGAKQQSLYLLNAKPPEPGDFAGIPALLTTVGRGDVLLEPGALEEEEAAFPDNKVVYVPGIHGNMIEYPYIRLQALLYWLAEKVLPSLEQVTP